MMVRFVSEGVRVRVFRYGVRFRFETTTKDRVRLGLGLGEERGSANYCFTPMGDGQTRFYWYPPGYHTKG